MLSKSDRAQSAVPTPHGNLRNDIQILRGIAVLAVVLYHSGLGIVQSGYLGVDIFFVISGFLITGIVTRGIADGSFSFRQFYARRIRRLMPAGLLTLAFCLVAAMLLMTSRQYGGFYLNLLGSLTFVANVTLWMGTGYFHPNGEFQPLLHMWSLAIEEQYYLLMPLAMVVVPRRWWRHAILVATIASLAAAILLWPTRPGVAFFLLPARAWELGIGSFAALVANSPSIRGACQRLFWPAVLLIAAALLLAFPGPRPGLGAITACFGTATLILAHNERWSKLVVMRPLMVAGDISYSLYLVHWPIFAFTRVARMDATLPLWLSLVLIGVSLLAATALYRMVEQPFRQSRVSGRRLLTLWIGGSLGIAAVATVYKIGLPTTPAIMQLQAPITGLPAPACAVDEGPDFSDQCRQAGNVRMMLWGDSYAVHLVPGITATTPVPIMQATRPHCLPFIDYSAYAGPNEKRFAENCITYFRQAASYLRQHPEIEVVVIAGYFHRAAAPLSTDAIRRVGENFNPAPLGPDQTIDAMARTVAELRAAGKRVIVVTAGPPSSKNLDLGECWLRKTEGKPFFGDKGLCTLLMNSGEQGQLFEDLIAGFERHGRVPVVRLDQYICPRGGPCRLEVDGMPIFRDEGHITPVGSIWLGKQADLGVQLFRDAR